jgi:hypothetical protein
MNHIGSGLSQERMSAAGRQADNGSTLGAKVQFASRRRYRGDWVILIPAVGGFARTSQSH